MSCERDPIIDLNFPHILHLNVVQMSCNLLISTTILYHLGQMSRTAQISSPSVESKSNETRDSECTEETIVTREILSKNVTFTADQFDKMTSDLNDKCIKCIEDTLSRCKLKKEKVDHVALIGAASCMNPFKARMEKFFGRDRLVDVEDPHLAVVHGLAKMGSILTQDKHSGVTEMSVRHKTPFNIGIEYIKDGKEMMDNVIERDATPPSTGSMTLTTNDDDQGVVQIKLYQGLSSLTKDNLYIGDVDLEGIRPNQKAGKPCIEVEIKLTQDEMIEIHAVEILPGTSSLI